MHNSPLPEVIHIDPAFRDCEIVVAGNDILVVNPATRVIVDVNPV
ncbi:MAG: hypothetical protein WCD20_03580 [Rhodomicrobium sp.]